MMQALPFPDISPVLFSISLGDFELALRWYALAYVAGIGLGWAVIAAALKRPALWPDNSPPMDKTRLEDLSTWIIIGIIAGGRLGYVLFYQPGYYLANPGQILQVWQGGMSFHGGFGGVVIAVALFCRKNKVPLAQVSDSLALVAPIGLLFGRIANFINAELWGRVTDVPWAVVFPGAEAQSCAQAICARHPSQLYEAALEGLILGAVTFYLAFRKGGLRKRWRLTGIFLTGYGLSRFIVEFFRQPDAQFQTPENPLGLAVFVNGYGLTMGQILSLPMIAVGIALIVHIKRRAS